MFCSILFVITCFVPKMIFVFGVCRPQQGIFLLLRRGPYVALLACLKRPHVVPILQVTDYLHLREFLLRNKQVYSLK